MAIARSLVRTELGEVPEDWPIRIVSELASCSSGTTPSRAQQERYFNNGTIPWVKTLDLNNSVINFTQEMVTDVAVEETSLRVFPENSILVAMYGGFNQIGRTGILRFPAAVNQALTAIVPMREELNSKYLQWVLNFRISYWRAVASSSRKDPNITGNDVRRFPLCVPPTIEQEAIAEALSDADALIESLEQLIAKKRQLKQGAMQELLTGKRRLPGFSKKWERIPFEKIFSRVNSKSHQIFASEYKVSGQNPVVDQGKDLVVGFSDNADKCFRSPNGGVIIFGDHTCIVKFIDFDFLVGADGTQILVAQNGQNTQFHAYQLSHKPIMSTGYNRHFKFLKERTYAAPELSEQRAITELLFCLDQEIWSLEKKLFKFMNIKQGMMQELLTGRIRLV